MNAEFRIGIDEIGGNFDDVARGGFNLQKAQQHRSDPLIDEDAPVLWVVLGLEDVEMPVIGFDQVSLRSTAHTAEPVACANGHCTPCGEGRETSSVSALATRGRSEIPNEKTPALTVGVPFPV